MRYFEQPNEQFFSVNGKTNLEIFTVEFHNILV